MPRVGEVDAMGWSSWTNISEKSTTSPKALNASTVVRAESAASPEIPLDDGYRKWAAAESSMDVQGWLSTREDTEDPYATVLFSDIRPFLFPPSASSTDLSILLVLLEALGLHVSGLSALLTKHASNTEQVSESDSTWSYASFMKKPHLLGSFFAIPSSNPNRKPAGLSGDSGRGAAIDELITGRQRSMGNGWGPVKEWSLNTHPLLEGYGLRGEGRMWEGEDMEGVDVPFIRLVCRIHTTICAHSSIF